jgi:TDG/mug DNA glycosylase family protein
MRMTSRLSALRLADRVRPGVRILFVGINPGVRSALTNHHFAGHSNRFWKVLFDAGLVSEPVTFLDDDRLPEWGLGVTNLIRRPTPGIDALEREEYDAGLAQLRRKVRRWKPRVVAFLGITLYRFVFSIPARTSIAPGEQCERFEGARVFALPNPSGRNATFSYTEMVDAFASLEGAAREGAAGQGGSSERRAMGLGVAQDPRRQVRPLRPTPSEDVADGRRRPRGSSRDRTA